MNVEKTPADPRRRWRRVIWGGAIFLFVCSLFPIYWVAMRGRASSRASAELERIRAAGEPTTFEEVIQSIPPLPPEEDCTALYQAVFAEVTSDEFYRASSRLPYVGDVAEVEVPPLGEAWPDLEAAAEFLEDRSHLLAMLEKARAMGGQCRFPLTVKDLEEWNSQRAVSKIRQVIRLLHLRADVAAHRVDTQAVCDALLNMRVVAECLAAEPDSYSLTNRWSLNAIVNDHTARIVGVVPFTDAQVAELQADLRRVNYSPHLHSALMCDRVIFLQMLQSPKQWWLSSLDPADAEMYLASSRRVCDATNSVDVYTAAKRIDEIAREVRLELSNKQLQGKNSQLTKGDMSGAQLSAGTVAVYSAFNLALDALLACERYRLAEGAYPTSVDQLVPKYLPSAPNVARFGGPLRILHVPEGIVVYFIGADGKDAGGALMGRGTNVDDIGYRTGVWKREYLEMLANRAAEASAEVRKVRANQGE